MYYVRAYRKEEARTVQLGPYFSAADAWAELDRLLASGQYSNGFVDQEPDSYRPGPQEPAPWWGR